MNRRVMTKAWRLTLVGLVSAVLWAGLVDAQPRSDMMGRVPGLGLPMLLRGANLTPDQQARVREIVAAHRPTFRALGGQLRAAQEEMAAKLFAVGPVMPEDLTPYLQRIAQLRDQLFREGMAATLEVRAVLTPEQLAKAAQIHDRMKTLRAEMRSLFEGAQ